MQESIHLDEIKLAGGYTYDPQFLPLSDEDNSEPAASDEDSSDAEATEEPPEDGQPTVKDFLDANLIRGQRFRGVEYSGVYGSTRLTGTHGGIDLADITGTPIFAALGGSVTYAGKDTRSNIAAALKVFQPGSDSGPNGNYVKIRHEDGTTTMYLHLDTVSVSTGAIVTQGQQIGTLGNTGRSDGPHLHLHTYDSSSAVIDPITWMTSHPGATFPVQVAADE